MRVRALALLVGVGSGACLRAQTYACDNDQQCQRADQTGVCTLEGWCAYEHEDCGGELAYSPNAPVGIARQCVPATDLPTGTGGDGGDTSPPVCLDPCDQPPGDCWLPTSGMCVDGVCTYVQRAAGEACADDCPAGGHCDADGTCICDEAGSESSSGGVTDDCEATCIVGPHATDAACNERGQCILTCTAPWQDCDAQPDNGCEIPVGVAHQCDATGLNPVDGCWTAYCGSSEAVEAVNFDTWYCIDCITCQEDGTMCRWCNHDTGVFYAYDEFGVTECCGEDHNVVCGP